VSTALDIELEEAAAARADEAREATPPAPTTAAGWKRDLPEPHTLPSGNVATLQRPKLMELLKTGKIPNTLLGAAIAMAQGKRGDEDVDDVLALLDMLVAAAFVEPKVWVAVGDDDVCPPDELPISDLSDSDRNYVLVWAQRGAEGLRRFRLDGASPDGGGDGGDVRDAAE
jgi:hypothetical protein